jgi:hypothetical protein
LPSSVDLITATRSLRLLKSLRVRIRQILYKGLDRARFWKIRAAMVYWYLSMADGSKESRMLAKNAVSWARKVDREGF